MDINLKDKTAIVTGAGRGIGKSIAAAFAAAGAKVIVNDIDGDAAAQVCQEIKARGGSAGPAKADVRVSAEIAEMVQMTVRDLGGIQVMVNNAGVILRKPAEEILEETGARVIQMNLKGTFLCAQTAAKAMIAGGKGGKIINISRHGGRGSPPQGRLLRQQGRHHQSHEGLGGGMGTVRNCGERDCAGLDRDRNYRGILLPGPVRRYLLERIPLNRLGKPEDIAHMAVFLHPGLRRLHNRPDDLRGRRLDDPLRDRV